MSDLSGCGAGFTKILQMLEEEHCREISKLRQEHAKELDRLHCHQVTSLDLKNGPEQSQNGATEEETSISNTPHNTVKMQSKSRSASQTGQLPRQVSPKLNAVAQSVARVAADVQARLFTHSMASGETSPDDLAEGVPPDLPETRASLKMANNIVSKKVAVHLEERSQPTRHFDKVAAIVDNYAQAKGWGPVSQDVMKPKRTIQKLVEHQGFDIICAVAICLNTALLGAVTSFHASVLGTEKLPVPYDTFNWIFSFWFLIELALRWISEGFIIFLCKSPNWTWNLFDIFIVGIDMVDILAKLFTKDGSDLMGNLNVMRMLRVARFARALRVIRLVQFCRDLRVMVQSLLKSGMMLLWCVVLLSIIFYIFSIFVMQAVTEHLIAQAEKIGSSVVGRRFPQESVEAKMYQYFGTLSMTFYMLFQSVSGGISWGELADMLKVAGVGNAIMFCIFIFFTVFAMLNVINGFFVDACMGSIKTDEDEVIREEVRSERSLMRQLHNLFVEADSERKGSITEKQFTELVENPRANALLKGMGLNLSEAQGVFAMLDLDVSGEVCIDDFIIGFMRIRGGAQEVDLVSLMYETRKILASQHKVLQFVEKEFERLDKFEDRVDDCLKDCSSLHRLMIERQANSSRLEI